MKMTVSDYIVEFLIHKNIDHVFGYQGGMIAYLFDSLKKYEGKISYHIPYHEQGGAFEACGYAQETGRTGFVFVTSGPGFTNTLTGIANAFCDSIPLVVISGQVNYKDKKHSINIRQKGFQELDTTAIAKPLCKKVYDINFAEEVPNALDEAFRIAESGRKGPVFLDIPINVFREFVDVDSNRFLINEGLTESTDDSIDYKTIIEAVSVINQSKRPVIIAGSGIKQSNLTNKFREFVSKTDLPVVTSMLAVDVLTDKDSNKICFIGPDAKRTGNHLVSKSDCIISLGSRLDPRQTGYNISAFAPNATLIRVEIDPNEFNRVVKNNSINICCDIKTFMEQCRISNNEDHKKWLEKCRKIKTILDQYDVSIANTIVQEFSNLFPFDSSVFLDVGKNELWGSQSVGIKEKTKVFMSGGLGSMGYSLPAAIGSCFATKKPTISINGDGGIQMNIQEFQTIVTNNLPVKIIVLNNHALGNVVIFQDRWLGSRYVATCESCNDYHPCNIIDIANAYGIRSIPINNVDEIKSYKRYFEDDVPTLFEIHMPERTPVLPDIAADRDALRFDGKLPAEIIEEIESIVEDK